MADHYQFEQPFQDNLSKIPMSIRYGLDIIKKKLSFDQWMSLSIEQRQQLISLANSKNWKDFLTQLKTTTHSLDEISSDDIQTFFINDYAQLNEWTLSRFSKYSITESLWKQLNDIDRYSLIKLSHKEKDNKDLPSLIEELKNKVSQ